jgi:hypothetical protein
MTSPDEGRIVYVDQDDGPALDRSGQLAVRLAVVAAVVGMVYLAVGQLELVSKSRPPALNAIEEVAAPATGFDASSADFTRCDPLRHTLPDFSIVVAGGGSDNEQAVVSRVVQFVVVSTYRDYRYGRDLRAESLCTLS